MFYPVNAFLSSDIDNIAAKRHPSQTSARIANNSEPARETFFEDNRRPARFAVLTKQKPPTVADGFGVGCGELWGGSAWCICISLLACAILHSRIARLNIILFFCFSLLHFISLQICTVLRRIDFQSNLRLFISVYSGFVVVQRKIAFATSARRLTRIFTASAVIHHPQS